MAKGLAGLHDVAEARTVLDQAVARADLDGESWYLAELLRFRGELELLAGADTSPQDAEDCFRSAIDVARQQGALFWELQASLSLVHLMVTQKRQDEARDLLTHVYGKYTEGFETANLREARTILDSLPPRRV